MRQAVVGFSVGLSALVAMPCASGSEAVEFAAEHQQFVQSYCVDCHGPEKQKGDFRIDDLSYELTDEHLREQWDLVLDYVEFEDMPVEEAKHFPSDAERQAFVKGLSHDMELAYKMAPIGRPGLRRLNRHEYLNSLNHLMGVDHFELPDSFPTEFSEMPFDTMPEGLFLSPALLDAYLETATLVADHMVPLPDRSMRKRGVEAAFIGVDLARKWTREGDEAVYLTGSNISPMSGGIWVPSTVAHTPGMYRVRLLANAEAKVGADGKPLRFSFHLSDPSEYQIPRRALNGKHPRVATVDVPNTEPEWIECLIPVEEGERIYAFCENRFAEPAPAYATMGALKNSVAAAKASGDPTLRVLAMEVEGPVAPLPRQLAFLKHQTPRADSEYLRSILLPFAENAFRRPLSQDEADKLIKESLAHISASGEKQLSAAHAVHYGIRRVLTSPAFLYLEIKTDLDSEYNLASRLSFFLWSSPPDDTLLDLAARSKLSDPTQLEAQVARMIADPRSFQFVKNFAGQWLETRRTESLMVCDVRYQWGETMRLGFIQSAERFLKEIFHDNLPISTFIDSDFVYANEPMLESWGVKVQHRMTRHEGDWRNFNIIPEMKRVNLSDIEGGASGRLGVRGGILGLPSVLAATGDGVESSPILRGVWVLDNLFGTPVPPPPANVPAIDVDISKAKGVREILSAHKENESCNKCHRKIDPVGLALENYDAIGGWRTLYQETYRIPDGETEGEGVAPGLLSESAIDASGQLPDGFELSGPQGIKEYLLANRELFTRCLTTKLFEYGTGREPTLGDRRVIDQIVSREPESGYRMIDLITELVRSESFMAP